MPGFLLKGVGAGFNPSKVSGLADWYDGSYPAKMGYDSSRLISAWAPYGEVINENLQTYSNTLNNATYWNVAARPCSCASGASDPLGGTAAFTVTASAGAAIHMIYNQAGYRATLATEVSYVLSCYVKYNNYAQIWFGAEDASYNGASFNIQTGTVTSVNNCTATITAAGNGYYKLAVTYIPATAGAKVIGAGFDGNTVASDGSTSFAAAGTEVFYLYNVQVRRSVATSGDVITTATAVTADILTASTTARPTLSRTDNYENFLTYSEAFQNAVWTTTRATTTDNNVANPLTGTTTAARVIEDGTAGTHTVARTSTITLNGATAYRFCVYAQSRSASSSISLYFSGAAFTAGYAHFDLKGGQIDSTDAGVTAQMDRFSSWYRCTAWCTTVAGGGAGTFTISVARPAGTVSYTGDSTSGVNIFGAQVTYSGSASAYLATTSYPMYAGFDYGSSGIDVVPKKTEYWAANVEWAPYISTFMNASGLYSDQALNCTYYEGELARYMLSDYTRTPATYYPLADECYHTYRNYYCVPSSFVVPGYWAMGEGFAERYIRRQWDVNFILNPTWDSGTTSWVASNSTLASVAGGFSGNCLQVTNVGANQGAATQTYAGWKSTLYSFSCYFKKGTCANGRILVGTSAGGAELYDSGAITDAAWAQKTGSFTTPSSSTVTAQNIYITLRNETAVDTQTSLFDSISLTTVQAKTDLETLCANASFHGTSLTGFNTIAWYYPDESVRGHNLSREWSYCVYNYIQLGRLETLTAPMIARRDYCFNDLLRIVDWWYNGTADYFRPFMGGLLARSLIAYYDYVSQSALIIPALQKIASLITAQYISSVKSCYYTDRDGTGKYWSAGSDDRNPAGAPDLNQLISPLYGWLWKMTGLTQYRTMGDNLFQGGIPVYSGPLWASGAYWGTRDGFNPLGKQYDQAFDWGKRYLEWAENTPTVTGKSHVILDGAANTMSGVNGAAAQPTTDFVVLKCTNDTSANRTIIDNTGHALSRYNTTGQIELNAGSALTFTNTRGNREIITTQTNGASSAIRLNRRPVASGAAGANAPGATIYLGANSAAAELFRGDIYEWLRYNRALTADEMYRVEAYLGQKHSVTLYTPLPTFDATLYGTPSYWPDFTTAANVLNSGSTPAAEGEAIMTINDKSANAFHLTQATVGYRPTCRKNIVDTWQVARFDGARGFAWSTSQAGTLSKNVAGITMAISINSTSYAANQNLFQFYNGTGTGIRTQAYILQPTGNITQVGGPQDGGTVTTDYWTSGMSTSVWYIVCMKWDFVNNIQKTWVNNVVKGTNAACGWTGANSSNTDPSAADGEWIFFNYYGSAGIVGDVGEMVMYSSALSDSTIATMCTAFGAKYGLTI